MTESASPEAVEAFLGPWLKSRGGAERANFANFIHQLTAILRVPPPGLAEGGVLGDYQFEGPVPEGSLSGGPGSIDLYKRGCFVMEAKQSQLPKGEREGPGLFDDAAHIPLTPSGARYDRLMMNAQRQAKNYAVHLPGDHPRAPFLIVCDIGRAFEIFYDFTGNGRGYGFFPDKLGYRIPLARLRDPETRALLRDIWISPETRDPSRQTIEVTRKVSLKLADISKHIESERAFKDELAERGPIATEEVALFLMRLLFCMFAEDIGLFNEDIRQPPEPKFTDFLRNCTPRRIEAATLPVDRETLEKGLRDLWTKMAAPPDRERWTWTLKSDVRYFNGGLFESQRIFPLDPNDLNNLIEAAEANWRKVEPAIFGTLLEQALPTGEREKLGAHYTPRAYVERLIDATVMEVLNAEWDAAQDAMTAPDATAKESLRVARSFHDRLAAVRVLDPACGTGNFLYVAMEAIERLEARVIETIESLGGEAEPRVGPHQFFGLELNPRAARITKLVLWIGWLRFRLQNDPYHVPEPVLRRLTNINFGRHGGYDAVLNQNDMGEADLENPMASAWPEAEFIVGNPPFLGKGAAMRGPLGDEYLEALWKAHPGMPKSADFVMFWWDRAATILASGKTPVRRFGFVTTNSITDSFNRRVVARHLSPSPLAGEGGAPAGAEGEGPAAPAAEKTWPRDRSFGPDRKSLSAADAAGPSPDPASPGHPLPQGERGLFLAFAIPDHPWTKATKDAAAVRIAMTVAERGAGEGRLLRVTSEAGLATDDPELEFSEARGRINDNLTLGADVANVTLLRANAGLSCTGMMLAGQGFKLAREQAEYLIERDGETAHDVIRPHIGGSELVQMQQDEFVIDFFGLSEIEARRSFPITYQHVLATVKPERDRNRRDAFRNRWWIFGEPRSTFRPALAGLSRYIATTRTSKHRIFQFVTGDILPNHEIVAIASDDSFCLGVLQSCIHVEWAARAGATLEDRPRYNKGRVFDPFPLPDASPDLRADIAALAEELDATRKEALAATPGLTMTEIYNLRARLRSGAAMTPAEQDRAMAARAGIVDRLHEQIDAAVAAAYGWPADLPPAEIVARLVALNAERAAEERAGKVRWLRPEYQAGRFGGE